MKRFPIYFSLIFLIFSCSDILDNVNNPEADRLILIESLKEGETIDASRLISFKVLKQAANNQQQEPAAEEMIVDLADEADKPPAETTKLPIMAQLDFNLFDREHNWLSGTSLLVEYEQEELRLFSELFPNPLTTGQYFLNAKLYQEEEKLESIEISFFFTEEPFEILSIESFPPVIYPNITVDLRAELLFPPGADPFLRWKENGYLLNSGLFSAGLGSSRWKAPEEPGIYALSLELFPVEPENINLLTHSSIAMNLKLFVSDQAKPSHRDLTPEDSYFALFHFAGVAEGKIRKDPERFQPLPATLTGNPLLVIASEDLAYSIGEGQGITIPEFILPLSGETLAPFTLSLGIQPTQKSAAGQILSLTNVESSFNLVIFIDTENYYSATLQMHAQEFTLNSGIQANPQRILLSLSCLPQAKTLQFSWYKNSHFSSAQNLAPKDQKVSGNGITYIGGTGSFTGLIDELGVYYRNAAGKPDINGNLFRYAVQQKNPGNYLFTTGFDSLQPEPGSQFSGNVEVKDSLATLFTGAALTLPFSLTENTLQWQLMIKNPDAVKLRLLKGTLPVFQWQAQVDGNTITDNLNQMLPVLPQEIALELKNGELILSSLEPPLHIPFSRLPLPADFLLEISSSGDTPLVLDAITLLQNPPEK